MKKRNLRMLAAALTEALTATGFTVPALAASDWSYTMPTSTINVDTNDLTTLTQRAASEIAAIYGVNVMGGYMFTGLQYLAGTEANEDPDPYIYNYNATQNGVTLGDDDVSYQALGNAVTNPNGLYQSGGGNQAYVTAISQYGSAGYAIGMRSDVIFSFNSALISQISWVQSLTSDSEYYQEGDESYNPLMADVSTGNVTSRLYSWSDNGQALSRYLEQNTGKTTRYDDPAIEGEDVEAFSAGIPYYIASLIADGTLTKKTMAYTSGYSDGTFTCIDPDSNGDVRSDTYGEVDNFNFLEGTYTPEELMEAGVDIIVFNGTGYSYTDDDGNIATMNKSSLLSLLAEDYDAEDIPLVMDQNVTSVQPGNNGYNYSPITPMFMPYVQVYAYFEELAKVNEYINPAAMVQFMVDECFHIDDDNSAGVASYYIGSNWDSIDETYDRVPDIENYTYDKEAIIEAIQIGAAYALSGAAEENGNTLTGAYSTSDTAYQLITGTLDTDVEYLTTTKPSGTEGEDYYEITLSDGTVEYVLVSGLLEIDDENEAVTDGEYSSTTQSFQAIMEYYDSNGYTDDFSTTLNTYAERMEYHVWEPETSVAGSYLYGVTASDWQGHNYKAVVTEPTCTEDGYTTYTCSVCGDTYTDDYVEATGHNYENNYCTDCDAIERSEITSSDVSLEYTSAVYDGSKLTPEAYVTINGYDLEEDTDYTVSYSNNLNVGTATVTIKGKGDYSGTVKKTFKITKASQSLTVKTSTKTVKYSKVKKKAQTVKAITKVKGAKGTVTYKKSSGSSKFTVNKKTGRITVKKGTKKGTYTIKIKVKSAATSNYKAASKTVTVKIKVK